MEEMDSQLQSENPYTLDETTLNQLMGFKNNPGLIIEHAYSTLIRATEGKIDIPNPTTSFSYLLETSALHAATLHNAHEATYRNQYPRLATRYEHLYNHMFDDDYIGRFATPGRAKFEIYFKRDELFKELEQADEYEGYRRITIPRGSFVTTQDFIFTLLYPIEILMLKHGEISILYLTDNPDPVQPLNTNILEWNYVNINGTDYLRIRPTLLNIKLDQVHETVTTDGFNKTWNIPNRFCHCRVYQERNGKIEELVTTHSDLVYNPNKVTARLRYLENKIEVIIPPIYSHNGLLGSEVFVEFYTTVGKVEEPINEYKPDAFNYQWGKLEDDLSDRRYVTPLEQLSPPIVMARTMLSGGSNGQTFEETRERVINRAGYVKTPITPNQIETGLKTLGYEVLKARDTLTSRSYLASRALPINKNDAFTAGAAASMETIKTSMKALETHPHVRDNGRRLTITPEMLFKNDNGVITPVSSLNNLKLNKGKYSLDEYVQEVNKLQYMYTPFYYVMDPTKHIFKFRGYYLDKPEVENQIFVANNRTSGFSVSSDEVLIIKFEEWVLDRSHNKQLVEGYKVRIRTTSTDAYRNIPKDKLFCQLAIKPFEDKNYASINGVLLGTHTDPETENTDDVWEFTIKTKWDLSENHNLVVHDFFMYLNEGRNFEVPLRGEMFFVYGVKDLPISGFNPDIVDKYINRQIIDSDEICGIAVDKITYRFGWYLNNFWSNGVPIQGNRRYQTHQNDVPRVYSRNVYDIDDNGIYLIENANLKILHRAGDPVLDSNGQPVLLARKGDVVIGPDGNPVPELDREVEFLIDIMMVDGIYYFADDEDDVKYRNRIGETVKNWVVEDLKDISDRLLENTVLYFYPKRTMGDASLIIDGGLEIKEPTRQSFKVTYYMDEARYQNMDIRRSLTEITHRIINEHLTLPTVTMSDIISDLNKAGGEDIVAVYMDKMGAYEDRKYAAYTTKHGSDRCSVKRLLEVQSDNTLKVVEDIEVNFVKHQIIPELKRA